MTVFWNVLPQEFLDDSFSNFGNFRNAFLTLFNCSTGESWNALMHELMQMPDSNYAQRCTRHADPTLDTCGAPLFAGLFMVSFQVVVSMVILNICVAVVLEHFEEQRHERERELQLDRFKRVWAKCGARPAAGRAPAFLLFARACACMRDGYASENLFADLPGALLPQELGPKTPDRCRLRANAHAHIQRPGRRPRAPCRAPR